MELHCTRPSCPRPKNFSADLDDKTTLKSARQKYCTTCGMPLILAERYIPSKLLGKGGFGAAFLAFDRFMPGLRQCVVKQFQPSGDFNPQQLHLAQTKFEQEAAVLEELGSKHPQIPNLYAFFPLSVPSLQPGKDDQFFYLVQEFIDGKTLEEELETQGSFSAAQALEVLQEVLKVLKFVHESGSIHRDIKPSNIMRHQNGRLYLLDFGAVKQVTQATSESGRSTGIYTPGYAPLEQMRGSQVFPSTDLYALAVTVIVLLTGKDPQELYDNYNNQWNWKPYTQVSDGLADILDRMLLSTPNQRFPSAQDALDAIAALQAPPPPRFPSVVTPAPPISSHSPAPPPAAPINPQIQPRRTRKRTPAQPVSPPPAVPSPSSATTIPPVPQAPNPPPVPVQPPQQPAFPLIDVLSGAAFTGFEGALLFIACRSLLPSPGLEIGLWGMLMGGLIFAEF
ncbi:MAG TPA: serine/threonine-protein kinase, partial [Coleofasciculaceae cyanobacterium]